MGGPKPFAPENLSKIVDAVTGVRVTEDQEIEGLDITQHGEEAYNLES